jgi:hypothetical protein
VPHVPPNFLYAALDMTACAAFCEESRMKCANANKLHRKFGGTWGTRIGSEEPLGSVRKTNRVVEPFHIDAGHSTFRVVHENIAELCIPNHLIGAVRRPGIDHL